MITKLPTLADIVLSAQAAANTAVSITTTLERQASKLKAFADSNFHADDFPNWENAFYEQLQNIENLAKQPSIASKAGKLPTNIGSTPVDNKG
ncbi:MAG TPA: hypothetical protein VG347_15155 [Verrucomicrobiae bacterium]|nr:hypothetical protein [Verrucomicrobiae bacterium]